MSGSSRSRSKRKLEPISIEELAGTTGMSGFCSFLTRDSSVPVPALDHLGGDDPGAPVIRPPVSGAGEEAAPNPSVTAEDAGVVAARLSAAAAPGALHSLLAN